MSDLQKTIEQHVAKSSEDSASCRNRKEILESILTLLDLTTLEGTDNTARITKLCEKALSFKAAGLPSTAAVCVYPPFVAQAKMLLQGSGIHIAAVAGAFPSGQSPIEVKEAEVDFTVKQGADEIDMVISRGAFLEGDFERVRDEVAALKKVCGSVHLKVILETGELGSVENITKASELAIEGGGDFIKTSTGKIQPAATPEAMAAMLLVIHAHFKKTGKKIGIKPAGGISTPDQALLYWFLVKNILGNDWLNNDLFRIGASRLADTLAEEIMRT